MIMSGSLVNYNQSTRSISNSDRLAKIERHNHDIYHTDGADAPYKTSVPRVVDRTPEYLSGIGGWY